MNERQLKQLVEDAIRCNTPTDPVYQRLLRAGDPAFDAIVERIRGGLSAKLTVKALRCLVRIGGYACVHRLPDVIELSLDLLESEDLKVRSVAADMAIGVRGMLKLGVKNAQSRSIRKGLMADVRFAMVRALGRGLDPQTTELVESFLARTA